MSPHLLDLDELDLEGITLGTAAPRAAAHAPLVRNELENASSYATGASAAPGRG